MGQQSTAHEDSPASCRAHHSTLIVVCNAQLTKLLQGCPLVGIEEDQAITTVTFQGGMVMRINAEVKQDTDIPRLAELEQVLEEGGGMEIRFRGAGKLVLRVVDPGKSVSVRDAANNVVYLG